MTAPELTPTWGDRRLVVFAGAGISAVPPSDLPSWWHFNEAVLDGARELVRDGFELPDEVIDELDRLSIDDVGVTLFSEVVTSCFAGVSWFDLLCHLDGAVPGPCHDALSQLAEEGLLAAVVTTNFDTLIERAFADRGVPLDVYVPFDGVSPAEDLDGAGPCRLVKVHGSVTEKSSLIDLARQKARGLPPLLRAWLSRTFAEHPLLVAGFSGADLELGEDYFGFDAALPRTPWLRWVTRPGRPPLPAAATAVATAPGGLFLEGELPDVLATIGIDVPEPRARPGGTAAAPRAWVDVWLAEPGSSPEACAALAARLLAIGERPEAAASLRDAVRAAIAEKLTGRVDVNEALGASLALAQFGGDLGATDPEQALVDLAQSRRIIDSLFANGLGDALTESSRIEQLHNLAGVLCNAALCYVALSKLDEAEQILADLRPVVEAIPPAESVAHRARAFHIDALVCRSRDRNREALIGWRQASRMAESSGSFDLVLACAENRWRTLTWLGEIDLARRFLDQAIQLRAIVPTAPRPDSNLDLEWGEEQRRAVFPALIERLETEARSGGGRFDEVLYSAWMAAADADDLREQLRQALISIAPSELDEIEPLQRALAAIARHTLTEGDEIALLDPALGALIEWFSQTLDPQLTRTFPEAELVMHPELRDAAVLAAQSWGQAGISQQREEEWENAERLFLIGGYGLALAGERSEAARALLYAVDAMARQGRYEDAEALLEWLGSEGGPENTANVLSRRIKLLTYRVAADELDPGEALERSRPWLQRLEDLDDDDQTGAALASLGSINRLVGDNREAVEMFERAEALFSNPEHKKMARVAIEQTPLD